MRTGEGPSGSEATGAAPTAADTAATFCATLVDEWIRFGVRHAVIAPGSRSTPMALALAARQELHAHVFHDERSAGFAALGLALATGVPAVVLCSSGTAAAHLHAAVIEAHQSHVPMIVCTADRPIELRDVGAPQTIDQTHLYGRAVRWFVEPGVAVESQCGTWRSLASRAAIDSTAPLPGPVHLNLAFREPLLGTPGPLPEHREEGWHRLIAAAPELGADSVRRLAEVLDVANGVIVAGRGSGDPQALGAFAASRGWPILADPRSGCRTPAPTTIAAFDALLRNAAFAAGHRPQVVVRTGDPQASKVLAQWIAGSGATQVHISEHASWVDPDHMTALRVVAIPSDALAQLPAGCAVDGSWLDGWCDAESVAQEALSGHLGADRAAGSTPLVEPGIARTVTASVPAGGSLVVSASMPVRDVEWFSAPRQDLTVYSNRGANGIDGVVSTAIGVALGSRRPTTVLIGDVAFLHDSAALTALARRHVDLTIVVVDNDGGGIFSFLPQHGQVPPERFELVFGTPHGTDIATLCRAHHLAVTEVGSDAELHEALARCSGISVVIARTDRTANVDEHDALNAAVSTALQERRTPT